MFGIGTLGTLGALGKVGGKFRASAASRMLAAETQGLAIDFTDTFFQSTTGFYGSARIKDTTTPANNYDSSPTKTASSLLTYTSPSVKMTMGPLGTMRFGAHNLLLQSQTFDNASWTKNGSSVTADQTAAPDGTVTADLITATTTSLVRVQQSITGSNGLSYAFSVYLKAGSASWAIVSNDLMTGGTGGGAWFNLSTGTVGTIQTGLLGATIQSVGNGWYRCTVYGVSTVSGSGAQFVFIANGDNTTNATNGSTIYAWGAQSYRYPADTTYLSTTSSARYALPYEWSSSGTPLGELIEPQRTNVLTASQTFTTNWTLNTSSVSSSGTAPDGTTGILWTSSGAGAYFQQQVTLASGNVTASCYVKAGNVNYFRLSIFDAAHNATWFNLSDGTVGKNAAGNTATITALTGGWYRVTVTRNSSSGRPYWSAYFCAADGGNAANGDTGYPFAAQFESGTFASSYVATSAATVSRFADAETFATSAFPWSATAGTLLLTGTTPGGAGTQVIAQVDDGTENNRFRIVLDSSNNVRFIVTTSSVEVCNLNLGTVANSTAFKVAAAWAANDFAASLNGGAVGTDSSGSLPTVTSLKIGKSSTSGEEWGGYVGKLMELPVRKPNADLQTMSA